MHWAQREKKPLLLKVRRADHPYFILWHPWFHQLKACICILISCIEPDVELFQLLQNSSLAILSLGLGLGKFIIKLRQIVRRLLKRVACCQTIQYQKRKGNYSPRCFPPTDHRYPLASKRTKFSPTTNCSASPRASHPKFQHPQTKVISNLSNHILSISTSSKNARWNQASTINIELMTSILTTLWFSMNRTSQAKILITSSKSMLHTPPWSWMSNVYNTLIFHFSRNRDLIIQHKSASPKIEST